MPSDAATLERGKYLVERRAICIECHDKDLGGKIFVDNFAFGRLAAANLTRGRGGIGSRYTDEDFVRVLVHGVNKSGHSVIFMPSQDARFTEPDLAAIIAYIRSVPPVDREPAATRLGPIARALTFFHKIPLLPAEEIDHDAATVLPTADATDPVGRGRYLVDSGGCRGCHTPGADRRRRSSARRRQHHARRDRHVVRSRTSCARCASTSDPMAPISPKACRARTA